MNYKSDFKKNLEAEARQERSERISDAIIILFFVGCFILASRFDYLMFFAE